MAITNRVRVAGSGFTLFTFGGQPIAFAQQVGYVSPPPVSAPVAIHPMDEPNPVQVITPAASGMGSITLNLYELYNSKVWDRLGAKIGFGSGNKPYTGSQNDLSLGDSILSGAVDITDLFIRIAEAPQGSVNVVKYVRPPLIAGTPGTPYSDEFHGCVITDVRDGEEISVGTMEVIKQVTVGYTHITRNGRRSRAWAYRDRPLSLG